MRSVFKRFFGRFSGFYTSPLGKTMVLFGIEGILLQYITSINTFGNNLYATNLGATDTQVGLVYTISNVTAVAMLLPAGILSERMKSSKTVPVLTLIAMGVLLFFYGSVPMMGENRMLFYFIFLGLSAGTLATYNAQWQAFFGDVVLNPDRNRVLTFRNRFMFLISMFAPLACGSLMAAMPSSEEKLRVLQVFFYINGALAFVQAFVVSRIRGGEKPADVQTERFSIRHIGEAIGEMKNSKRFREFFIVIVLFYISWHFDWSMWYIGEVQYCMMTEAHLSAFSALTGVMHLLTIGLWSRLNQKKGVEFTVILGASGLVLSPIAMLTSVCFPEMMRPYVFIAIALLANSTQNAIALCIVQMMLGAAPKKRRALIISLYTMVVTLSNGVMPFVGVQVYTWLGADMAAFTNYNWIVLVWRLLSVSMLIAYYRHTKKQRALEQAQGEEVAAQA